MTNIRISTTFNDTNKQTRLNWTCLMIIMTNETNIKLSRNIDVYKDAYESIFDYIYKPYCCHICRQWFKKKEVQLVANMWFCKDCAQKLNHQNCDQDHNKPSQCRYYNGCIKSSICESNYHHIQPVPHKISVETKLSVAILCLRTLVDKKTQLLSLVNYYKDAWEHAEEYIPDFVSSCEQCFEWWPCDFLTGCECELFRCRWCVPETLVPRTVSCVFCGGKTTVFFCSSVACSNLQSSTILHRAYCGC